MKVSLIIFPLFFIGLNSCQIPFNEGRKSEISIADGQREDAVPELIHWRKYFSDPQLVYLIDQALAGNSDLKIAVTRIDSANAKLQAARSALAPTVGLAGSAVRSRSGGSVASDFSNTGTNYGLDLQASWELDLWGKLRSERGAAYDRLLGSFEAKRLVQSNLVAEVASAYYDLKSLDTSLEVLDRTLKTQKEALDSVEAQHEAGQVTSLGVEQFQAQLKNIEARKFGVQNDISSTEGAINLLIGRGPTPVARSKGSILTEKLPRLASGSTARYLANRPDIRGAELELAASKADVKAAQAAFYPTVTIDGILGLQAFNPSTLLNSRALSNSVGAGLVAPLINRGAIKAQFAEANAAQLEALYTYQQAIVNGYVEVHNQIAANRLLQGQIAVKNEECDLLEKSESTSIDLFRAGRAGYLEILTARQSALEASFDRIDIKKQQMKAGVNLYRALGGG